MAKSAPPQPISTRTSPVLVLVFLAIAFVPFPAATVHHHHHHHKPRYHHSPASTMIAVQRPVNIFSPPSAFSGKPSHSRNPSAPVVVRPTHTPGLLSLSKPAQQPSSRPQQAQQYARAPRSSARGKANQRSPQPAPAQARLVEDAKKSSQPNARTDTPSAKAAKSATSASTPERPVRGRQPNKPAPKDKADTRGPSPSVTSSRAHARRTAHQPSPSPTRIPQQADIPSRGPVNPFRAQSFEHRDSDSNLFDPFVASSSDNESDSTPSPSKAGNKTAPIPALALASRPSGKLARRRQAGHANGSPATSQALAIPRSKGSSGFSHTLARSEPALSHMETPKRLAAPRFASGLPLAEWDEFPVSDETLFSPPSTPVRPSATVPRRTGPGITWQQSMLDEAPRTAPLSSTFNFPFAPAAPCVTPSPAHRRRHHQRVPSEGVFAMSTDEESSTDSSDELKKAMNAMPPFDRRAYGGKRTPSPPAHELPAGFYAGSVYQNSPSPDDLPVPAFRV